MTISTQKELQELNVSLLLNPTSWDEGMNDEADFDVLSLNDDPETLPASSYLVVQTPGDNMSEVTAPPGGPTAAAPHQGSSQVSTPSGPAPESHPSKVKLTPVVSVDLLLIESFYWR